MELRNLLFSLNVEEKEKAKKALLAHVDKVMDSFYGVKLVKAFPHGCKRKNDGAPMKVENVPDINGSIARAWRKETCKSINSKLMQCSQCGETCSHHEVVSNSLNIWRNMTSSLPSIDEDAPLTMDDDQVWPSRARLDIAAYTYSYHMSGGCANGVPTDKKSIWKQICFRSLLKQKNDEHCHNHIVMLERRTCVQIWTITMETKSRMFTIF